MQAFLGRVNKIRERSCTPSTKYILISGAILLFAALYFWGAFQQAESVNTKLSKSDQSAYMDYTKDTVESNFADIGGRNRMPVYPILLSLVYDEGISDEVFFQRGKLFNIALSIVVLAILTPICFHYLSRSYAISLIVIVAFTVFMFKAGFVQAEILYYFFHFLAFLLLVLLIKQPDIKLSILTGIVIAFAHLTKASILPMLVLGVFFLLFQQLVKAMRSIRLDNAHRSREIVKRMIPAFKSSILVVLFFLITIFPYIQNSKERFGQYFYNVNSTFYIWYDSWDEVKEGTKAFGDRAGWPDMPPEDLPSLQNYLRDHNGMEIAERFQKGFRTLWNIAISSYGYFKYGIAYLFAFIALITTQLKRARELIKDHIGLSLFFLSYIIAYLLLTAWFVPIARLGERLMLAHFLPLMFSLSFMFSRANKWFSASTVKALNWLNTVVFIVLPIDIYLILTHRIFAVYGGK